MKSVWERYDSFCKNGQLARFLPDFENWGKAAALIIAGIFMGIKSVETSY